MPRPSSSRHLHPQASPLFTSCPERCQKCGHHILFHQREPTADPEPVGYIICWYCPICAYRHPAPFEPSYTLTTSGPQGG